MIRPTTIPQTLDELIIEQAIAREFSGLLLSTTRAWQWDSGVYTAEDHR